MDRPKSLAIPISAGSLAGGGAAGGAAGAEALSASPASQSAMLLSQSGDNRARKVTIGFSPTSGGVSASYRSQIPGWSREESDSSIFLSKAVSQVDISSSAATDPAANAVETVTPQLSKAERQKQKLARRAGKTVGKPQQQPSKSGPNASSNATNANATTTTSTLSSAASNHNNDRHSAASAVARDKRSSSAVPTSRYLSKEVALLAHLNSHGRSSRAPANLRADMAMRGQDLHPAIVKLGLLYQNYAIVGSNNRAIAMLQAFCQLIQDYQTPPNNALCRHLDSYLKPQINYLVTCRPISVSMGNAIRYLKMEIAGVPPDMTEDDAKSHLTERISTFIRDRILFPQTVIAELGVKKIRSGDVILTFCHSSVVERLLISAHRDHGLDFRVIVVDSRPLMEGKKLLQALNECGIPCTYSHLNALAYALKSASKVFIGAHALLSNGYVMSRVGTAMVSMMAHEMGIPVITCCETYKFSDRVQLDSFVQNELGDPDDLLYTRRPPNSLLSLKTTDNSLATSGSNRPTQGGGGKGKPSKEPPVLPTSPNRPILDGWREKPYLKLLNLMYDVTPSDFITMVITEVGMIPCSSVPVVLREGVKSGGGSSGGHHHYHNHQNHTAANSGDVPMSNMTPSISQTSLS